MRGSLHFYNTEINFPLGQKIQISDEYLIIIKYSMPVLSRIELALSFQQLVQTSGKRLIQIQPGILNKNALVLCKQAM